MYDVPINCQFGKIKICQFRNGLVSKYSMKNSQYPKDLILAADIMKNNRHDDSGKRKIEHKTSKKKIQETKLKWREGRESNRRRISSKFCT